MNFPLQVKQTVQTMRALQNNLSDKKHVDKLKIPTTSSKSFKSAYHTT